MRKVQVLFMGILTVITLILTGCGEKEETLDYYVIEANKESLAPTEMLHSELRLLGMQYSQEELLLLKAESKKGKQGTSVDLYLCKLDGSKELLLTDIGEEYLRCNLFLCEDGSCLAYRENAIKRLDETGSVLFEVYTAGNVVDVCQLPTGDVFLLIWEEDTSKTYLQRINIKNGEIAESDTVYLGETTRYSTHISAGEKVVYLLNSFGVQAVDLKNKSTKDIINFQGTNYQIENLIRVNAFCVKHEDSVEIVRGNEVEYLQYINMAESRKILYFETGRVCNQLTRRSVDSFNKSQDIYYVAIRTAGEEESNEEYRQRINLELMAGKGADIIMVTAMSAPDSLLQKGVFLDMSTYLAEKSIREEDYFPVTFNWYREGEEIYGISYEMVPIVLWVSGEVLKDREIPTITELVDAYMAYDKPAVNMLYNDAQDMLSFFLYTSEDLWGMIDWEAGSCSFQDELFVEMLQVAKRYAYDETKAGYFEMAGILRMTSFYDYLDYEKCEEEGNVIIGRLFNDGAYSYFSDSKVITVNANSNNKEGALEFVHYMLTEGQNMFELNDSTPSFPVSIAAYDTWFQEEMEAGVLDYRYNEVTGQMTIEPKRAGSDFVVMQRDEEAFRKIYDLRPEEGEKIKKILLDCRMGPTNILPILDIIYEEADAYFKDEKTIEEIIPVIENRVQLYLDERN